MDSIALSIARFSNPFRSLRSQELQPVPLVLFTFSIVKRFRPFLHHQVSGAAASPRHSRWFPLHCPRISVRAYYTSIEALPALDTSGKINSH